MKERFLAVQDGRVGDLVVVVAVISTSRFAPRVCVNRPRRLPATSVAGVPNLGYDGAMAMQIKKGYAYLEPRPGSFYQELFMRGVNLRPSRLVAWMEAEGLTPAQAAADRSLPLEAILEAMDYVKDNAELIAQELQRERQLLSERDLLKPSDA